MSAEKFIDYVEATDHVDVHYLNKLRRRLADTGGSYSVEDIAKVLVKKEQTSQLCADKMVDGYQKSVAIQRTVESAAGSNAVRQEAKKKVKQAGKGKDAKTVQPAQRATQRQSTASPRQSQKKQGSRQQASPPVVNPTAARAKRIDEPVESVLDASALLVDPVFAGAPVSSPVKTRNQSALEQRRGRSRRRLRLPLPAVFCFLLIMGLSCLAVFNTQRIGLLEQQLASGEPQNGPPGKPLDGDDAPDDGSKSFKKRSPDDVKTTKPTKTEKPTGNEASAAEKEILAEVENLKELIKRLEKRIGGNEAALDELRVKLGEHKVRLPGSQLSMRFVSVPAGTFTFGNREGDINQLIEIFKAAGDLQVTIGHDTKPAVRIRVSREFFILDHEVTRGQFAVFQQHQRKKGTAKGGKPSGSKKKVAMSPKDLLPQTEVTWEEAQEFCKWIGELAGREVRLPTEIEWEYAARGHEPLLYPWKGNEFYAWAGKNVVDPASPRPVNAKDNKDVSWAEVYDMAGNVNEWCLDRYENKYHRGIVELSKGMLCQYDPNSNEWVKKASGDEAAFRTFRGGSYVDHPGNCTVSGRRSASQSEKKASVGFRPVLLLAPRSSGN